MPFSILGWLGTFLILGNHAALSAGRIGRGRLYYGVNLAGSLAVTVYSLTIASWQAVAINLFWTIISLVALTGSEAAHRIALPEKLPVTLVSFLALAGGVTVLFDIELSLHLFGWAGALLLCASYLLFSSETISRRRFLLYNIFVGIAVSPVFILHANWPALALEAIWSVISLAGFLAALRKPDTV